MKMNCDNNMETVYILMVHFFCINSLKVPRTINTYGRADSKFYSFSNFYSFFVGNAFMVPFVFTWVVSF